MQSKGLKRLIFLIVFLIPVCWYLFLQVFGKNNFSLNDPIPLSGCDSFLEITAIFQADSLDLPKQNQLRRVEYGINQRGISLIRNDSLFDCLETDADLLIVSKSGLWGSYILERDGVDRFFTEIDILKIQESYGEGVSR